MLRQVSRTGEVCETKSAKRVAKQCLSWGWNRGGVMICVDEYGVVYSVWPGSRYASRVMAKAPHYVVGTFYVDRHEKTRMFPTSEVNAVAQQITYTLATLRGIAA